MDLPAVVVRKSAAPAAPWEPIAKVTPFVVDGASPGGMESARLAAAGCALVAWDPGTDAAELARAVHGADPTLQVVVVADPADRPAAERAFLFARAGEVWVVPPEEVGPALFARAGEVTAQRRSYRATHARLGHDLLLAEPHAARRAVVSDAYLAAVLSLLPDPVLSIGEDGRILSWNAAAESVFGRPRHDAVGRALREVLGDAGAALVAANGRPPPGETARAELRFWSGGEERIAEVALTAIEAAGHRISVMVVHDLTEIRYAYSELEEQAGELEAAQLELEMANDELRGANEELAARSQEAEAANRAKAEFLSAMSHELRTPLNAIGGYTELLEMGIRGPVTPAQLADLHRIKGAQQHLLSLINDVLNFAKLEAGRLEISREPIAVAEIAEGVDSLLSLQRLRKDLSYTCTACSPAVRAWGDAERVRQVLLNLLGNAVKFTPAGGHITLTVQATAGEVQFSVTDTGRGIPADKIDTIFDPFIQIDRHRTDESQQGIGLGLAISRDLARAMGGELSTRSIDGHGSTFTLSLNRAPDGAAP